MADQASQVSLENKTEHVLHITLAGGDIITVPPKESGATTITFNTSEERERFEQALQTDTVRHWIDNKELVVNGLGAVQQQTPGQQMPGTQTNQQTSAQVGAPANQQPETVPDVGRSSRRSGRE